MRKFLLSVFLNGSFAVLPDFDYPNDCPVNSNTGTRDSSCLQCKGNKMMGAVRFDAIFLESLSATTEADQVTELLSLAKFNTNAHGGCSSNFVYDSTNKVFTFDIELGKCGMTAETRTFESESYIKFSEELTFDATVAAVFFGTIGSFKFHCNYKTSTSTDSKQYEVTVRETGGEAENFLSWDNSIGLDFYTDDTFTTKMSPNSLIVGERFNFELDWSDSFSDDMPVKFYASSCTVTSDETPTPTNTFDIIKDGCISDLVIMSRHFSGTADFQSPYDNDKLHFSYKSFSFLAQSGSFDLKLSCQIGFCLKADLPAAVDGEGGTCGFSKACSAGYSHGIA